MHDVIPPTSDPFLRLGLTLRAGVAAVLSALATLAALAVTLGGGDALLALPARPLTQLLLGAAVSLLGSRALFCAALAWRVRGEPRIWASMEALAHAVLCWEAVALLVPGRGGSLLAAIAGLPAGPTLLAMAGLWALVAAVVAGGRSDRVEPVQPDDPLVVPAHLAALEQLGRLGAATRAAVLAVGGALLLASVWRADESPLHTAAALASEAPGLGLIRVIAVALAVHAACAVARAAYRPLPLRAPVG